MFCFRSLVSTFAEEYLLSKTHLIEELKHSFTSLKYSRFCRDANVFLRCDLFGKITKDVMS